MENQKSDFFPATPYERGRHYQNATWPESYITYMSSQLREVCLPSLEVKDLVNVGPNGDGHSFECDDGKEHVWKALDGEEAEAGLWILRAVFLFQAGDLGDSGASLFLKDRDGDGMKDRDGDEAGEKGFVFFGFAGSDLDELFFGDSVALGELRSFNLLINALFFAGFSESSGF